MQPLLGAHVMVHRCVAYTSVHIVSSLNVHLPTSRHIPELLMIARSSAIEKAGMEYRKELLSNIILVCMNDMPI